MSTDGKPGDGSGGELDGQGKGAGPSGKASQSSPAGPSNGAAGASTEAVRRHEAHLVGQIYHLIEANHRLEEQLHRLGKVTEIADLFREKRITRDTFELKPPKLLVPVQAETAWNRIDKMLTRLDEDIGETEGGLGAVSGRLGGCVRRLVLSGEVTEVEAGAEAPLAPEQKPAATPDEASDDGAPDDDGSAADEQREAHAAASVARHAGRSQDDAMIATAHEEFSTLAASLDEVTTGIARLRESLVDLRDGLGVVRESAWSVDPDWQSDVRGRLVAAEQAVAFLNEQSRELDMLRREKDAIVDGASRLEQNIEDLWKALNEKTTHIQRIEAELSRIWVSLPYRIYRTLTRPFRGKKKS